MAKPSTLPTWDTNETNTVVTTGGHASDGYVADEIPASDEFNYWMNLVYKWFAWLDGHVSLNACTVTLHPITGYLAASASGLPTTEFTLQDGAVQLSGTGAAGAHGLWRVPVNLRPGERIVNIRVKVEDSLTNPTVLSADYRRSADGVNEYTSTPQLTDGSGTTQTLTLSSLNDTVVQGKVYEVVVGVDSGWTAGISVRILQLEVDIDYGP